MKRSAIKPTIEILLFLLLTVCALVLLMPVSAGVDRSLESLRDSLISRLESETGLRVSYKSLSPSILKSIRIEDLVIVNASNSNVLASVSRVSVSYDLFSLMRGDLSGVIRGITLENGSAGFDGAEDAALFDKLRSFATRTSSGTKKSESSKNLKPLTVRIKNFEISYRNSGISLNGSINSGHLSIDRSSISFGLDTKISCRALLLEKIGPLSSRVRLSGTVNRTYDTGTATLMLSGVDSQYFTLSRLGLVTSLRNGVLSLSSVQDLQPMDLKLVWNMADRQFSGSFNCDRLYPLEWFRMKRTTGLSEDIRKTMISGSATAGWKKETGLSFSVKVDSQIPESVLGGGTVSLDCSGTSDMLDIRKLSVSGSRYDLSYYGSINTRNLIPEGFMTIRRLELPNGLAFAGDIYLERKKNSVTGIIPQLTVGDASFSNIDIGAENLGKAWDFSLSANDETGHIGLEGTWSRDQGNFIQFFAAFDAISVSNTLQTVLGAVLPDSQATRTNLANGFKQYQLTTEAYFSTDFSDLSFNCNRLVIASAEKDGLYALFSVKGTKKGIDITDIRFSRAGYDVAGNIYLGVETSKDLVFDIALNVNTLPYNFHGLYSNRSLSVYGDYNLALSLYLEQDGGFSGSCLTEGLPVPVGPALFSLSMNAGFASDDSGSWKITLSDSSLEEMKGLFPLSTVFRFGGEVTRSGVFLENVAMSDQYSTVTGHAGLSVIPGESNESRFSADIALANADTGERYTIKGQIRSADDLFFESEIDIANCPLIRFIKGQRKDNLASFRVTCSGTPSSLMGSANIDKFSFRIGDFDLEAHAKLSLEDRVFSLYDAGATWNGNVLSDLSGTLAFDTMNASVSAAYNNVIGESGISSKVTLSYTPGEYRKIETLGGIGDLLDRFTIQAVLTDTVWKKSTFTDPIECSLVREQGVTAFYAGKNDMISGFLLDDGTFSLQTEKGLPVAFQADGSIVNSMMNVSVSGFHGDLAAIWPWTGLDVVAFQAGSVDGNLRVTGLMYDPEFNGDFAATGVKIAAPGNLDGIYDAEPFAITISDKTLTTEPFKVVGKDGILEMDSKIEFDRWIPVSASLDARTMPGNRVRLKTDNHFFKANGFLSCDLRLLADSEGLALSGSGFFENGSFAVQFSSFYHPGDPGEPLPYPVHIDLDVSVGNKVEFRWPNDDLPIIRGLVQSDQPFKIALDTGNETYRFRGTANLKGGEIFYVKRSFYLREGTIAFNENQDSFNPMVTLKAEVRERDTDGEPVRIILSVINQPLLTFVPVLSSEPPKSNIELLSLLGQAVGADSAESSLLRNTIVSASDIFTQMGLFRNFENAVRDVTNLDVFSIRTLLLQNALFGSQMQGEAGKAMTIGNYFDNTTVYMGKYLGSAIYADALLHFSYYDPVTAQVSRSTNLVYGNLLFQPEFGLEVATPFFFLRWGIAPSRPETLFIADNSLTLSWKFSY